MRGESTLNIDYYPDGKKEEEEVKRRKKRRVGGMVFQVMMLRGKKEYRCTSAFV
jgi:hypothetical protein